LPEPSSGGDGQGVSWLYFNKAARSGEQAAFFYIFNIYQYKLMVDKALFSKTEPSFYLS